MQRCRPTCAGCRHAWDSSYRSSREWWRSSIRLYAMLPASAGIAGIFVALCGPGIVLGLVLAAMVRLHHRRRVTDAQRMNHTSDGVARMLGVGL